MKTCNWKDLLIQENATWDELTTALKDRNLDRMELVLVYRLNDGSEFEFGLYHHDEPFSIKWFPARASKAVLCAVKDFLYEAYRQLAMPLHRRLELGKWHKSLNCFELYQQQFHIIDNQNQPHAIVFFAFTT